MNQWWKQWRRMDASRSARGRQAVIGVVIVVLVVVAFLVQPMASSVVGQRLAEGGWWFWEQSAGTAIGVVTGAVAAWLLAVGKDRWTDRIVRRKVTTDGFSVGVAHLAVVVSNGLNFPVTVREIWLTGNTGGTIVLPYLGVEGFSTEVTSGDTQPYLPQDKPDVRGFVTLPAGSHGAWGFNAGLLKTLPQVSFSDGWVLVDYRGALGRHRTVPVAVPAATLVAIGRLFPKVVAHLARHENEAPKADMADLLAPADSILVEVRNPGQSVGSRVAFVTNHVPAVGDHIGFNSLIPTREKVSPLVVREVVHLTNGERMVPCVVCSPPTGSNNVARDAL